MTRLTILSDMAGGTEMGDPGAMVARARAWGLGTLDLKTVMGRNIADLSATDARAVSVALRAQGMAVEALSTQFFRHEMEGGQAPFDRDLSALTHVLHVADEIGPRLIRLLAAETKRRQEVSDSIDLIRAEAPWLIDVYREAVDRIHAAGFSTVIENEIAGCIFAGPAEITDFFAFLDRPDRVRYTYDVQNLWEMGTFPSLGTYQNLRPLIGYLHVKGGRAGPDGKLAWRSPLSAASWPVAAIVQATMADGVSPCICLNPSHGAVAEGEDFTDYTAQDLDFLRHITGTGK